MVHITQHLQFSPVQIGWLLSGYGIATMISEGILVRIIVPRLGETNSMRLGLLAFALQCLVVSVASSPIWMFLSVLFSMGANLFYPSVSSLVSKLVSEDSQGEALGALNGIKALVWLLLYMTILMLICKSNHSVPIPTINTKTCNLFFFSLC